MGRHQQVGNGGGRTSRCRCFSRGPSTLLLEDFRFSSQTEPGIELADIMTNATRRAIKGDLRPSGYHSIPALMIHRNARSYIEMLAMEDDAEPGRQLPYAKVLLEFSQRGRIMSTPRTNRRIARRERMNASNR